MEFRSKVEGSWARFMDRVGWEWRYEYLQAPSYWPDFYVNDDFLLEVKADARHRELLRYLPKCLTGLNELGHRGSFVVVGAKANARSYPSDETPAYLRNARGRPQASGHPMGPGIICWVYEGRWVCDYAAWVICAGCWYAFLDEYTAPGNMRWGAVHLGIGAVGGAHTIFDTSGCRGHHPNLEFVKEGCMGHMYVNSAFNRATEHQTDDL